MIEVVYRNGEKHTVSMHPYGSGLYVVAYTVRSGGRTVEQERHEGSADEMKTLFKRLKKDLR